MTQDAGEDGPSNQEKDSEIAHLERDLKRASESAQKKDWRIADLESQLKTAWESVWQKESRIGTLEALLKDAQGEVDDKDLQKPPVCFAGFREVDKPVASRHPPIHYLGTRP